MSVVEVPWSALSADALRGVIEEFITREGTEYGERDMPLATKVAQVRRQLEHGEALIYFDQASASCQLLTRSQAGRMQATMEAVDE